MRLLRRPSIGWCACIRRWLVDRQINRLLIAILVSLRLVSIVVLVARHSHFFLNIDDILRLRGDVVAIGRIGYIGCRKVAVIIIAIVVCGLGVLLGRKFTDRVGRLIAGALIFPVNDEQLLLLGDRVCGDILLALRHIGAKVRTCSGILRK